MFKRRTGVPRRRADAVPTACPQVEPLEKRLLMHGDAHIVSAVTDNRGQSVFTADHELDATTIDGNSVRVYTAGPDKDFRTADDVRVKAPITYHKKKITVTAPIKANIKYRVVLKGSLIETTHGDLLDGEFNGATTPSGNGTAGGNYDIVSRKTAGDLVARFSTIAGIMDVKLYKDLTPGTVANFLSYANDRLWDRTFFHRNVVRPTPFVIQGGGFRVNSKNQIREIATQDPVENEPGIDNIRGRISMAKQESDPDSATNQWFFNLADNSDILDDQNGGFTAFGKIRNNKGLAVMDKIAAFEQVNAGGPLTNLPVVDAAPVIERDELDPEEDLIDVTRIAILNDVSQTPPPPPDSAVAASTLPLAYQPLATATFFSGHDTDEGDDEGDELVSL